MRLVSMMMLVAAGSAFAGPDVIVGDMTDTWRWGTIGDITSYTIGTGACNIGDAQASWIALTNQHPVIACNFYRLQGGRFEQIGMSWVKHGFWSENQRSTLCGTCANAVPGEFLLPGCFDVYDSSLNASQTLLGPRSEINAFTGVYAFPFVMGWQQLGNAIHKRIQVRTTDTNPLLNPDSKWFADAQYITTDESGSNRFNNASWRELTPGAHAGGGSYVILPTGNTVQQQPGLFAWQADDPSVVIREVNVPDEGRFYVAYRVHPDGADYRYEYGVYNLNSDRAAGSFSIPLDDGAAATTDFRDIHYHSGELISGADWTATRSGDVLTWATQTFAENVNANALRWHTLYNFTIVSPHPPQDVTASLGLWKPGSPELVSFIVAAPAVPPPACIADANGDGMTNGADLSVFLSAFGTSIGNPGYTPQADFNDDGQVGGADLSVLLADFGCPN